MTRLMNEVPGPDVLVATRFAPTTRSLGLVVVTLPLLVDDELP